MRSDPPHPSLSELIDAADPAWPHIQEWIAGARNSVTVIPAERSQGERTLLGLQVTTHSPLGAIALETAGILVDHGWLRILGAGGPGIRDGLLPWNGLADDPVPDSVNKALIVAHDVLGGVFAVSDGGIRIRVGHVAYFAPRSLQWEDVAAAYADFVQWALAGNPAAYYDGWRWPGWEAEVAELDGDQGLSIYPYLWTSGPPMAERTRQPVPMRELWPLHCYMARRLRSTEY